MVHEKTASLKNFLTDATFQGASQPDIFREIFRLTATFFRWFGDRSIIVALFWRHIIFEYFKLFRFHFNHRFQTIDKTLVFRHRGRLRNVSASLRTQNGTDGLLCSKQQLQVKKLPENKSLSLLPIVISLRANMTTSMSDVSTTQVGRNEICKNFVASNF